MLMTFLLVMACCHDDDEENTAVNNDDQRVKTVDVNGTFTITNICTGESVKSAMKLFDKDTLRIVFQPEGEFKDQPFTITCEDLKSIGESLFVLKSQSLSPDSLLITATCQSDKTKRAESIIGISVSHAYAVVPFWLQASQDLLLLSTAQVTYTDADGQEHTFDITDDDWVRPDSITMYVFKDGNDYEQVTYDKAEGLEKGWTLVEEEKLGPNATYTFDVRYYHLGIDASVIVTYNRKEKGAASADSYYLYHSIDRKSADITVPNGLVNDIYTSTNIDLTDHDVPKAEIDDYFVKLQSNPDIFKLNISGTGKIMQLK